MSFDIKKPAEVVSTEPVIVPEPPKPLLSDEERITNARAAALQLTKDSDLIGFVRPQDYYVSYVGPESSEYDWDLLRSKALLLELPKLMRGGWINLGGEYHRRSGQWININRNDPWVPIGDLRRAVDTRIVELGISRARLEEYFATTQTIAEEVYWRHLSFESRMSRLKEGAQHV